MMSDDRTLSLTSIGVEVTFHDDATSTDAEVLACANVSAELVLGHLRAAKEELAHIGVSLNWNER